MVLITDHNRDAIVRTFRASLTKTAIILRQCASEADGFGSVNETFQEINQVPCRLAEAKQASAIAQAGAMKAKDIFILTVPETTDVIESDRVSVDSVVYEITGDVKQGTWTVSKRFYVRRYEEA